MPYEVSKDGFLVCPDTGEVFGHVKTHTMPANEGELPKKIFAIESRQDAEFVCQLMSDADAQGAAIDKQIESVTANLQALKAQHRRRREWLDTRFGEELKAYAAQQLQGQKARSVILPWAKLAFRMSPPKLEVLDEAAAVAYCRSTGLESAVKVKVQESVDKQALKDMGIAPQLPTEAFRYHPAEDRFTVDTGIK